VWRNIDLARGPSPPAGLALRRNPLLTVTARPIQAALTQRSRHRTYVPTGRSLRAPPSWPRDLPSRVLNCGTN
jgi:hypothetical protein